MEVEQENIKNVFKGKDEDTIKKDFNDKWVEIINILEGREVHEDIN